MKETDKVPELSLVLVTKNRARLFERSLRSVIAERDRDYPDAEIVVIDGGSTDGTADILRRYADHLACCVSEPDSGVAEAINKGIARARTDVIRLIGDDDELIPGRLRIMMEAVQKLSEFDVVAGHNQVYIESNEGKREHLPQPRFRGEMTRQQMQMWGMYHGILIPEACYFRKRALQQHKGYDETIKWWGFLDLFLRMINSGNRFFVVPIDILITYQTPLSDTQSNLSNAQFWDEFHRVMRKHMGTETRLRNYFGGPLTPLHIFNFYAGKVGKLTGIHPRRAVAKLLGSIQGGDRKR
jgi:glycosyltransferase involved in cell wall biosynthesis